MRKPYFTGGLLLALAFCAMAAKANAADQPPPNMVGGIEQAQIKAQYQGDAQFTINAGNQVNTVGVQTLANEASASEDIKQVAMRDKAGVLDDSAANSTGDQYADSTAKNATAKTNGTPVAGKYSQQDLNAAMNHTSGAASFTQDTDTATVIASTGKGHNWLQDAADQPMEAGGTQTSADLDDDVRHTMAQPAQQHLATKQRPTPKIYGLLEASQSFFSYT